MAHNYQKRWVFTWNTDDKGQIVDPKKLQALLNEISKEAVFQKEKGEKTGRLHMQGRFKLKGPRTGKKQLLEIFSQIHEISNLTFEAERVYDSTKYFTKVNTRVEGPWYSGTDLYRTKRA